MRPIEMNILRLKTCNFSRTMKFVIPPVKTCELSTSLLLVVSSAHFPELIAKILQVNSCELFFMGFSKVPRSQEQAHDHQNIKDRV